MEESLSEDEDWFGIKPDEASREARRLYVADRIPTLTEKVGFFVFFYFIEFL